ncbi:glycosyltransferase [Alkalicoccobacillus plakortidis]|uniref:Glycosyltransferase family 2 protein n=1 Tax=Alkalicoccobacillus plakortidis TaxID=444060 RepID=A0ABT0XH41_9BACI|nr:glycosyltransferase family 2 protein [Alkalicoccobacillus plakortidis]MCM2675025.1 glycosyltransferase family 2 protein [Alkalicoccobacillus plakortidis]
MRNSSSFRVIHDKEAYLNRLHGKSSSVTLPTSEIIRNPKYKLNVIIPAMNEADTLSGVLSEINRFKPDRVIVVVNGAKDRTAQIAKQHGAHVIHYSYPLGNDLGRALGALQSNADIYLFTDADIVIKAEDYLPFIQDIENGKDVSINSIDWITKVKSADTISLARYFLNAIQKKNEIRAENVLTIPHAFSHKALIAIGKTALANPVLAHSIAIDKGLQFSIPHSIDVLAVNKRRANHIPKPGEIMGEAMQRMHGDSLEAFDYLFDTYGPTLHYPNQSFIKPLSYSFRLKWQALSQAKERSVIIFIPNGIDVIKLYEQFQSFNAEFIPILYNENTSACKIFQELAIPCISVDQTYSLGNVFYLGSQIAQGNSLFFHTADIPLDPNSIKMFFREIEEIKIDVCLNDQSSYLQAIEQTELIHIGNKLLNVTAGNHSIQNSSLLIPPFAMKRSVLSMLNQPFFQHLGMTHIKILEQGYQVTAPLHIESMSFVKNNQEELLSSLLTGFDYWIRSYGPRGAFTDGARRRDILDTSTMYLKECISSSRIQKSEINLDTVLEEEPIIHH